MTDEFMRYISPLVSGSGVEFGDALPHWPRLTKYMVDKQLGPYPPAK